MKKKTSDYTITDRSSPGSARTAPVIAHQGEGVKCATDDNNKLHTRSNISIGTWNVRTLRPPGKLEELTHENKAKGDPEVLKHQPVTNTDNHPILREEVEAAVKSLKPGKSAGVLNTPAELLQAGGETMIDVLLNICNKIWQTGDWPTPWTQSLVITLPKKGNLLQCQNYRTISLISHASKVMLKILLNRFPVCRKSVKSLWQKDVPKSHHFLSKSDYFL